MAVSRTLSAVVLAVLLAGCGAFGDKDPERAPMALTDFDPALPVDRAWRTSVGAGLGKAAPGIRPTHADGLIWAADRKGRIFAVDADSGNIVRRFDIDLPISAGPAVYEDRLIVGTLDGQLVVLDRDSGAFEWRAQLSSEILAAPVLSDGTLVVRCIDGRVFGIDVDTGRREWVYDRSVPLLTLRGNSAPRIRGGQVFVGHDDGSVTALDLTDGGVLWEQRVGTPEGRTQLDRLADIDGPLAIVGLDIYSASQHDRMASVALDSGRLLWVKEVGSHTGVTVSRTQLALSDTGDRVWMLDRRSGSTEWTNEQLLRRQLTRPVIQGGFVAVADGQGYVHWLDAETGEFVARKRAGKNAPAAAPLVVDDMLYLLDVDGKLTAWRVGAAS
jgi:outer membrane protein assembly factor BamB